MIETAPAEMHKPDVLRGTTAAKCAARVKDGTPKGSPSLLAGIDAKMVIIDPLSSLRKG
jgi:hypothetical protein